VGGGPALEGCDSYAPGGGQGFRGSQTDPPVAIFKQIRQLSRCALEPYPLGTLSGVCPNTPVGIVEQSAKGCFGTWMAELAKSSRHGSAHERARNGRELAQWPYDVEKSRSA
jgi:hypothetical protein